MLILYPWKTKVLGGGWSLLDKAFVRDWNSSSFQCYFCDQCFVFIPYFFGAVFELLCSLNPLAYSYALTMQNVLLAVL